MGWKKVIVSGSSADLLNVSASGGFKGNLAGNATTATTATQVGNSLTVDNSTIQLNSGTTYNGSGARTISIKNNGVSLSKLAAQANNTILGNVSGESAEPSALTAANIRTLISVESGADVTDTANVTSAGALMDSEVTSLALVKALTAAGITGSFGAASASFSTRVTANDAKLTANTSNVTSAGALMDSELTSLSDVKAIDQGLTTTSNVAFGNATLSGDLVVNGTTTTLNTTNLNVEDRFILVNSGSTETDAGIIFGGTSGTAQQGKALIWDFSYNSDDGRLAISSTDVAHNSTSNFSAGTTGYYVAGVFQGNTADAATAKADHAGNIRIESSEIYIYV